jgi:hypothetical protein
MWGTPTKRIPKVLRKSKVLEKMDLGLDLHGFFGSF